MSFARLFAALVASSITAGAMAESITFSGSYDGTYDPYSATPPAGQSTWVHGTAAILPAANTPTAGVANFTDASTTTRLQMSRSFGAGTFSEDQSDDIFTLAARMKLGSTDIITSSFGYVSVFNIGLYDEFNGTTFGKAMLIGFSRANSADGGQPGLWLSSSALSQPTTLGTFKLNNVNYFDDQWHTYTLEKYLDTGVAKLKVSVDGVQVGATVDYSAMKDSTAASGIGYWGGTPSACQVTLDYLEYEGTTNVPEPGALTLLAAGLTGLLAYAWRKRK